jgi:hypothetical protein
MAGGLRWTFKHSPGERLLYRIGSQRSLLGRHPRVTTRSAAPPARPSDHSHQGLTATRNNGDSSCQGITKKVG